MEEVAPVFIMIGLLVVLSFVGMPIAYALGISAIVGLLLVPQFSPTFGMLANYMVSMMAKFALIAAPLFLLSGTLMTISGITDILIDFARIFVRRTVGGLSHVAVLVNVILAGMSGSAVADASVTGSILIPAMKKRGYPAGYAAGIIAHSALIGPIIPPSVPMIFFAYVTGTSVIALFVAGVVPGLIMGALFIGVGYYMARRYDFPRGEAVPRGMTGKTIAMSLPALLIPILLIGGLRTGFFTPTEGAGFLIVIVVVIGLTYRRLQVKMLIPSLRHSAITITALMLIVAFSGIFATAFSLHQMGPKLTAWITGVTTHGVVVLLLINFILLLLGCFMDLIPIMIIFAPIFTPIAAAFGVSPVQFGVVMTVNMMIGMITPPFGLTMLLTSRIAEAGLAEFFKYSWPFLASLTALLMVLTYVPSISLWLPRLLGIII